MPFENLKNNKNMKQDKVEKNYQLKTEDELPAALELEGFKEVTLSNEDLIVLEGIKNKSLVVVDRETQLLKPVPSERQDSFPFVIKVVIVGYFSLLGFGLASQLVYDSLKISSENYNAIFERVITNTGSLATSIVMFYVGSRKGFSDNNKK